MRDHPFLALGQIDNEVMLDDEGEVVDGADCQCFDCNQRDELALQQISGGMSIRTEEEIEREHQKHPLDEMI